MAYKNYKDLAVWQKAMELTDEIYFLTKKLPAEEKYSLADQMRRAAVSVPSNIAEGQGRRTDADFIRFLFIAKGSLMELETQLLICVRQKLLSENSINKAMSISEEISRMITSFILSLKRNIK